MSREIKFRAWDKETKEMSYDFLSKNWLKVCVESPYVEVMQYTGLQDKNGTEIYEADALYAKGNLDDDYEEFVGFVEWDNEDARFEVKNFHGRFEYIPDGCYVKGNKFELTKEESA